MKRLLLVCSTMLTLCLSGNSLIEACFMRSQQPVQVWLDHINVDIKDNVAVKTYRCTFKNPNSVAVVGGTCYMELEPGAQVDNMSVMVDGKELKAEILDTEKAKSVFTEIVKEGGSPALLEFFGNQLIQTKVPKIAPNGTITVKLTYTTVLKKSGGFVRLQMLNTNPKALTQTLKSASVSVNINSSTPIKNIYSPTHEVNIVEKKGWDVAVEWSQENYTPKHPFVLYYQTDESKVAAGIVAHRELDEDGTFMMMLSPTLGFGKGKISESDIMPKDVVFCVDTSGSMLKGNKMEQAKEALKYCVEHLRNGDRFNIVDFSTEPRHFQQEGLTEVTAESRKKALRYVENLHARGGTAIQDALKLSLEHLGESDRLKMIVFTTDGLPTIGERNPEKILKEIDSKNQQDVRLFVFGEGFDVNTKLLDLLALDHRGEADYILPEEDITKKISKFFDRVGSPIMTDLKLEFEGLEVFDVYPKKIQDVYQGEQVVIYGRYRGHGAKQIKLTGFVKGRKETISYPLTFPEYSEDDKNSFVPRLWAGEKVDHLLTEIRKSEGTPPKELIDEVTFLAKRHGILTPYTSFLVTDDVAGKNDGLVRRQLNARLAAPGFAKGAPAPNAAFQQGVGGAAFDAEKAKESLVRDAKQLSETRSANRKSGASAKYYDRAEEYLQKAGRAQSSLTAIRYIGNRTYYRRGKFWYDSRFDDSKDKIARKVKVNEKEYFELLRKDARRAKDLALTDVIVQVGKEWVQIER